MNPASAIAIFKVISYILEVSRETKKGKEIEKKLQEKLKDVIDEFDLESLDDSLKKKLHGAWEDLISIMRD
jgi:hypothetical protein